MRITLTTLFTLFLFSFSNAQVPGIKWEKYPSTITPGWGGQIIYDAKETGDNGFIVVGMDSAGGAKSNIFDKKVMERVSIERLDSNGNKVWSRVGSTSYQMYNSAYISVIQSSDHGYVTTGYGAQQALSGDPSNPDVQLYVTKYGVNGSLLWVKQYGGANLGGADDRGMSVCELDGRLMVAGFTSSIDGNILSNHGRYDAWVLRLDAAGNLLWSKTFGGSSSDSAYAIIPTPDKGFLIAGSSTSSDGNLTANNGASDAWAFKIDSLGNMVWQKNYGGAGDEAFKNVTLNSDGTYTFVGYSTSPTVLGNTNSGRRDLWVVKTDLNGQVIWSKLFGGSQDEQAFSVQPTPDGNNIVSGYTESNDGVVSGNHGGSDAWQIKIYKSGNLLWQKCLGTTGDDGAFAGGASSERDFFAAGFEMLTTTNLQGYLVALGNANTIKGTLFKDDNLNGVKDAGESLYSLGALINVQKQNSSLVSTNSVNGQFSIDVDLGDYVTTPVVNTPYYNVVPSSKNSSFAGYFNTDSISFAVQPTPNKQDLVIYMYSFQNARPGFMLNYQIDYKNVATATSSGEILLKKDPRVSFIGASVAPTISGGDLRWTFANLPPGATNSISMTFQAAVPPTLNGRDTLKYTAIVTPNGGDETPSNDTAILKQFVVNSLDPNDKTENNAGVISPSFISNGDYLVYTVRFQNTGTADAINVIVRDTLGNSVDVNTLEILSASHPYSFAVENANQLVWTFNDINLPDSTTNEPASHGYIVYRIRPKSDVVVGETIHNTASIYFDYNLPVLTNDATTLVKDNSIILPLQLLNFTGQLTNSTVQLNWNVSNATNFKAFEVERSVDGKTYSRTAGLPFSSSVSAYSATDDVSAISTNTVFYRLKLVDADGNYTYSKVVVFKISSAGDKLIVYPNPARTELFVSFTAAKPGNLQVKILDASGRMVKESKTGVQKGTNVFPVSISKLEAGNYILQLSVNGQTKTSKFTVMD